ncbi:Plasma membrane proteolipid 3 [Emericellopsis cladophorae]|uniref:Plasma membrane proteolipid 3 n=1 Tax=Emericellopsis cladophorae TaxID=2686198 RepID=A0A9P9Y3M4_9HYPO|nr:Plasma membrane proteolipid 3 [Emericellopsis cladophorae]KAI6783013.1 Plasma membrane proteolipid 3 [Emericellopsis cladophorae]
MGGFVAVILVIVNLFLFVLAGCGMDLLINILLTILGYFPGILHGFYVIWVYYDRREQAALGQPAPNNAPGIYSEKVQAGGRRYGTMGRPAPSAPAPAPAYN